MKNQNVRIFRYMSHDSTGQYYYTWCPFSRGGIDFDRKSAAGKRRDTSSLTVLHVICSYWNNDPTDGNFCSPPHFFDRREKCAVRPGVSEAFIAVQFSIEKMR